MSNNKIMQFCYFYWNTNEKKAHEKMTLFHNGKCHDCDKASVKMHDGILFDILSALAGNQGKKKEKKVRGVGGGNYFKYFPLRGRLIEGWLLFEEI